ncbi:hypothetical protein DSO57_1033503 [Entomophthora muscae]|uniref:Uncharacterized protein n=1 Tax=Entomophthora muscae TaxID=34485 RepID=A0ACC2T006_9FUNG|nr:hypothetical protein DSO57_1033503 [Entomophthora muscae]
MNHLIFSAVLTACLGIVGHQYNHQHGPYNKPPNEYIYKEPVQLNSSKQYSWPTLVLPHSTQSVAIYTCVYYILTYFAGLQMDDDGLPHCDSAHRIPSCQLEANSEPTKEHHTKKAKAAKEPTSSSGNKKEASKQASKNLSPPPTDGSFPPPSSDPQDEPEEYSKKFKASSHVAWDPLAIHNICNVDRESKVPKRFPCFSSSCL